MSRLARALATDPRMLLLDEPLAALDAGTRSGVRHDLRRHLESFDGMRILVTHDPVDAYALADRIAILDAGRIVQIGTIAEVTAHPRSRYVADLIGTNLVAGTVTDGVLTTDSRRPRRDRRRCARTVVRRHPPASHRPVSRAAGRVRARATRGRERSATSTGSATGSESASTVSCR